MIEYPELLQYVKAKPFRPFQINMADGRVFAINHPREIRVGVDFFLYFVFDPGETEIFDHHRMLSLSQVESIRNQDAELVA